MTRLLNYCLVLLSVSCCSVGAAQNAAWRPVPDPVAPADVPSTFRPPLARATRLTDPDIIKHVAAEHAMALKLFDHGKKEDGLQREEALIATFGLTGVLDALEYVVEKEGRGGCHDDSHLTGRAAVRVSLSLTELAQACELRCRSGCMHGIMIGALDRPEIADVEHLNSSIPLSIEEITRVFHHLCNHSGIVPYGPGTCLHGAGHTAAMTAGESDLKGLARICMEAYAGDPTSQFYCGTGAYHQALRYLRSEDCETSYLPGACFIWSPKLGIPAKVGRTLDANLERAFPLVKEQKEYCLSLSDHTYQAACIFGAAFRISSGLMGTMLFGVVDRSPPLRLQHGKETFRYLCTGLEGELLEACVEGWWYLEFTFPEGSPEYLCPGIESWQSSYIEETCLKVARLPERSLERKVANLVVQLRTD